jgi:hypothetical protein
MVWGFGLSRETGVKRLKRILRIVNKNLTEITSLVKPILLHLRITLLSLIALMLTVYEFRRILNLFLES